MSGQSQLSEEPSALATFYNGWKIYQGLLIKAITPLSSDQLSAQAAPHLRSIGQIAAHIVAARAGWFHGFLGEGSANLGALAQWDRKDASARTAVELVHGLETTWQLIQNALRRWTPDDLAVTFPTEWRGRKYMLSRQWVVWHVLEHDLHHGGELSLSLGVQGLGGIEW